MPVPASLVGGKWWEIKVAGHQRRHENACLTKSLKYGLYYTFVQNKLYLNCLKSGKSLNIIMPVRHSWCKKTNTSERAKKSAPWRKKKKKIFPTKFDSKIYLHWLVLLVLHQMHFIQSNLTAQFLRYCQFSENSVNYRLATFSFSFDRIFWWKRAILQIFLSLIY